MALIFHITTEKAWQRAQAAGVYRDDSLATDGFIHCSTQAQVVGTANAVFPGQHGLVLLCIAPGRVGAEIRYEDCYDSGRAFPHIYGPLPLDAVVEAVPFPPTEDGPFTLPDAITRLSRAWELRREAPILEFDPTAQALIEPSKLVDPLDVPERCVLCFFQDVIATLNEEGRLRQRKNLGSEIGHNPVYEMAVNGQRLALCHPGVGAPLAAGFLEELIALGCRTFIACGGAGVLDGEIAVGHLVVPTSAVRDEGTSYHYLPPGREVTASPAGVAAIETVLQRDHVPYVTGKTWTTDAVYRETPDKIRLRRAEGCLTVEMEAAAFFAVAQFRGVTFAQILYGGDDVSSEEWDSRHWHKRDDVREKVFWLAAEACLEL